MEETEERDENDETQKVSVTKDVKLAVPGATPKDAGKYQTKLVWTLNDVPGK